MKTVKEIAEIYDVSLQTVYNWLAHGTIPTKKERIRGIQTRTVVDLADVDAFLKSKEE